MSIWFWSIFTLLNASLIAFHLANGDAPRAAMNGVGLGICIAGIITLAMRQS